MKVVVLVLLAALVVYCTAKPLKGKDADDAGTTRNKAFSRMKGLLQPLKGKDADADAGTTRNKAFSRMKGLQKPDGQQEFTKLTKGGKLDISQLRGNIALQVGKMGKTIQKEVETMHEMWADYKNNKKENYGTKF